MSSACIKWATEHLGDLNTLLTRQLSSIERDTPTWEECIGIVDEHAAMLAEVGVDFYDIITKGLIDGQRDHHRSHDRNEAASAKGISSRKGSLDANEALAVV